MRLIRITGFIAAFGSCVFGSALADSKDYVPEDAIVFITIDNIGNDEGVDWLIDSWHNSPRESAMREAFLDIDYSNVSLAVLPDDDNVALPIAFVMHTSGAGSVDRASLDAVILAPSQSASDIRDGAGGIRMIDNTGQEFAAWTKRDDFLIFGAEKEMIDQAAGGSSIRGNSYYSQFASEISESSDGMLFANNEDLAFADFLRPLEKSWNMTLFLSAEDMEWMGSAFDVESSDTVSGKFVFKSSSEDYIPDIVDDAEYLGEVFKRKFAAEKIDYTSEVSVDNLLVTLDFKVYGLEPLWTRLFENGVLSLLTGE